MKQFKLEKLGGLKDMCSSVYANPHFSDPILSHIDYKDYYVAQ